MAESALNAVVNQRNSDISMESKDIGVLSV
jgi:hypothetical protein